MIHYKFCKGKKIFVKLKNDEIIIDKFKSSSSLYLFLNNHKLKWTDIKCTDIYLPKRS